MTRALSFILSATLAAACATGQDNIEYGSPVISSNPELVAISPDVEVVANVREPVFRANNTYWLHRGDSWYRSDNLGDTWIRIATPPRVIASIREPNRYANYRPERTVDQRTREQRRLEARAPEEPKPQAPYPLPPQQVPPVVSDPGSTDQVPSTEPNNPPNQVPEPDDLSRPDRMRDR